jgi:hypothetical protein
LGVATTVKTRLFARLEKSPLGQTALLLIRRIAFVTQLGVNVMKITDGGMNAGQWYLEASSEVDLIGTAERHDRRERRSTTRRPPATGEVHARCLVRPPLTDG